MGTERATGSRLCVCRCKWYTHAGHVNGLSRLRVCRYKWYSYVKHINGISSLRVYGGVGGISMLNMSTGSLVYVCVDV